VIILGNSHAEKYFRNTDLFFSYSYAKIVPMIFLKKLQLQGFAWMNKKEGSEWNN
jgi:hypothetical protein